MDVSWLSLLIPHLCHLPFTSSFSFILTQQLTKERITSTSLNSAYYSWILIVYWLVSKLL